MTDESAVPEGLSLFISDEELLRRINPKNGRDRVRAIVKGAELRGFPRINRVWGGRYWPKVKAWLDADNGIDAPSHAEDGEENFDPAPNRSRRR